MRPWARRQYTARYPDPPVRERPAEPQWRPSMLGPVARFALLARMLREAAARWGLDAIGGWR